jgi:hypothetical protein
MADKIDTRTERQKLLKKDRKKGTILVQQSKSKDTRTGNALISEGGKTKTFNTQKATGQNKKQKVKKPSPTTGMQRKRSPMEKERVLSTMKSDAAKLGSTVRSGEEMEAAISGLDTLTSKGPGKLKLALKGGGRAYNKNS